MNVSYDYYRIFYFVAKYGSFTRAAEILGNSQPNITRAMNNLEAQTGLKLLVRSKKGVKLTPEGEQLFDHVKIAFHHLSRAEEEMESQSKLVSGNIVIGVSEIALHEVLLPVLSEFYRKYPNVKIQITNQSTLSTIEILKASQVHFALVTTPLEIKYPLTAVKIKSFREYLMAGDNFEELRKPMNSLEELIKYPWVSLLRDTVTRKFQEQFFDDHGIFFEPQMSVATTDQVLPMIKAGIGIGFVPENMIYEENDGIFRVKMDQYPEERSVCLVTNAQYPMSAASAALVDEIRKKFLSRK